MPAFCAAFGSFHPKSSVMYFVRVLTTVRVLPLLLTLTLIRSSTLTVSTFGVRSYSDQRYWSMQTSGSGQASRASELTAGLAPFCAGSVGLTAASNVGGVGWLRHRWRVGQSGAAARDISNGDTMLAQCCCSGCVDVFGGGGRRCYPDRRSGALDAERAEASEPGPDPTGESDRSAQRR